MSLGGSGPKAPDYKGAAEAQGQSSVDLTNMQTWANRPNLYTPWGSQTWTPSTAVDPSTGKEMTSWASNISLSPDQQAALDAQMRMQMGRSNAAEGLLGQATGAFNTPFNWGGLSPAATSVQAGQRQNMGQAPGNIQTDMSNTAGDWRQQAQDAVWKMQQPMLEQRRSQLETQLANQGFARGSEAWNNEMTKLGDEEQRARLSSIGAGRDEASMLFNQDLAGSQFHNTAQQQQFAQELSRLGFNNANVGATLSDQINAGNFNQQLRQQGITEEQMKRNMPLNELNALMTGQQVGMPQMPNFSNSTRPSEVQYLPAAQAQYQSSLDAYNGGQAGMSGMMGGLFGLGSAAMNNGGWGGLFNFSDERLKEDIKKLFTLPNGVEVCSYRFKGSPFHQIGVVAQQVQQVLPEAVRCEYDGFLRVDYNKVLS